MQVADALKILGVDRVIWIDDVFGKSSPDLANMLYQAHEIAVECDFPELRDILAKVEFASGEELIDELAEALAKLSESRRTEIRDAFFSKEAVQQHFASHELSGEAIDNVCKCLAIADSDRWTFDRADKELPDVCRSGDSNIAFIIDLNETGGSNVRGLDMLRALTAGGSRGTAFILTHEIAIDKEAQKEQELRATLADEAQGVAQSPICVIAKERLFHPETREVLEEQLLVSIKRASLRRSLFQVVSAARPEAIAAFDTAVTGLLNVPPEQLEEFVYDRGYREGVSELHVVERIITSQIAQRLRFFFGTNENAQTSASRLRKLRGIKLAEVKMPPDPHLSKYRLDEMWEPPELINSAFAPVSCGDVFATDVHEQEVKKFARKFVVLAQPCDIALRSIDKPRAKETALLVPLVKHKPKAKEKNEEGGVLPFELEGEKWCCDFADATVVNLPVLDLVSFRSDGRVRLDLGYATPEDIIPSLARIYGRRVENANKVLSGELAPENDGRVSHPALQLTFAWEKTYSHFYRPKLCDAALENRSARIPSLPKRITWRLQRVGRVRPPYSIAFLEEYLKGMGRRAFDMNFMSLPSVDKAKESAPASDEAIAVDREASVVPSPKEEQS